MAKSTIIIHRKYATPDDKKAEQKVVQVLADLVKKNPAKAGQ